MMAYDGWCVLGGGVGAARLLSALQLQGAGPALTAVINTGDDCQVYGLLISPDLDSVMYALSERNDAERGWGRRNETWRVLEELRALGADPWFALGDLDLAIHLYRTQQLLSGITLTEVTADLCRRLDISTTIVPMTNDQVSTHLIGVDGTDYAFQEWFVRQRQLPGIASVYYEGASRAVPSTLALDAIRTARVLVIAPSNPVLSIAPILAMPDFASNVAARRERNVAISPLIGGSAVKGPTVSVLEQLDIEPSVVGVASLWAPYAATMLVDPADVDLTHRMETLDMRCIVTPLLFSQPDVGATIAALLDQAVLA